MSDPNKPSHPAGRECFAGNGEMAARMQSFDWSKTPVGPVERWPQSLKTTVRIMLTSRYAMWMAWGPELTFFYNDAYTPTLGIKHTWALGSSSIASLGRDLAGHRAPDRERAQNRRGHLG